MIVDADALEQLGEEAVCADEEQILPSLIAAAERLRSARLWQWADLLQRSINEHEGASRGQRDWCCFRHGCGMGTLPSRGASG